MTYPERNDDRRLLDLCLSRLDRGDVPDSRYPDAKGEYWPLCPFHGDRKHGSFHLSEEGYKCFACGESGGLRKLAEHLHIDLQPLQALHALHGFGGDKEEISLETYAQAKRLPVEFLEGLDISERKHHGKPALRIPYLGVTGEKVVVRWRTAMSGKTRFKWANGSAGKLIPYGLWRLKDVPEGHAIFLVEGESDAQTLWFHGLPALGIPGASNWKADWATYLEGYPVYIWQEPDQGGETFVEAVCADLPDAKVVRAPDGIKDVSEAHCYDPEKGLDDALRACMPEARPYRELQEEKLNEQAAQAKRDAGSLPAEPDILAQVARTCQALGLVGEDRNAKLLYLALTSRLLKDPVSVVVKGPSSAGKSFLTKKTLALFPETASYELSSMSEHALAYTEEPLEHRHLVIYEATGAAGEMADYLIRTLLSEGRVRYETVEKTSDGLTSRLIDRPGPTGFITTTTNASLHPENETRLLSLTIRDDREQTLRIFDAIAQSINEEEDEQPDLTPWLALQTWLELGGKRKVYIPYARQLAGLMSPAAVRLRRDLTKVFILIQAHAMLHQETRERDAKGRIIATLADYRAIYDLVFDLIDEGVEATVNPLVRETVEAVARLSGPTGRPVGLPELSRALDLDKSAASRRVKTAKELGYIVDLEERPGKPASLILGEPLPNGQSVLPAPEALTAPQEPGLRVQAQAA